ncbi:13705_t:CDS:2, partial [Ambispora leptoticha]
LELVCAHLNSGRQIPPKSNEMIDLCQTHQYDISSYDAIFRERCNIALYKEIKELKNLSNNLINEWAIYSGLSETFSEDFDLDTYWHEKMTLLPNLSKIALLYIWLPVSGVDVERSFSAYKRILTDNRHALSENSLRMLNFLNFN